MRDMYQRRTNEEREDERERLKGRPKAMLEWAVATFGDYARKPEERVARLLEEAVELAQAAGLSFNLVSKVVVRAFDRPPGDVAKELAQVGLTLETFAASVGADLSGAIDEEFVRVRAKPKGFWEARAANKRRDGTEDVA